MTGRSCTEATTPVHSDCQFVLFVPQLSQKPRGSAPGRGGTLRRGSYGYIKRLGYLGYGIDFLLVWRAPSIQCLPLSPPLPLPLASNTRPLRWSKVRNYHLSPFLVTKFTSFSKLLFSDIQIMYLVYFVTGL